MRTYSTFVLPTLLLIGCNMAGGGRTVELAIEGADGQMAYFDRFENNKPVHVDSVKLDGSGQGTIRLAALPLDFYRIAVGNEQLIVALDSTESLSVKGRVGTLDKPESVTGSVHSELLYRFQADGQAYERQRDSLSRVLSTSPSNLEAMDRFNALNTGYYEACKTFVKENSGSPVALSAVNRLSMETDMDLLKQVRDDLRKTMPRSGFFAMFRDQVDRVDQQVLLQKMQEEEMKRLGNLLPIGGEAPEIRQNTPEGGTFALSQLRGKVVLIDFWASWCRPCRIENPAVKKVYEKHKRKGFEILGVSLDRDHNAWVQAIAQDGIDWKHVSDLGFWNNAAAQEYGVSSIPFTVLLDREGKILAKGLRAHDLELKLAEVFGS